MAIKVIKRNAERSTEKSEDSNKFSINYEQLIKQLYTMCKKMIDMSSYVMDNFDLKDANELDEASFDDKFNRINKIMTFFLLVFGKKYTIIELIAKSISLINDIQKIADKVGISLVSDIDNDKNAEIWCDEDVEIMKQIVDNIGAEQFKKDIDECYAEHKAEQERKNNILNKNTDNITEVYEVFNDC